MLMGVFQKIVVVLLAPRDLEGGVRSNYPFVESACDSDYLRYRPGFIAVDGHEVAAGDDRLPCLSISAHGGIRIDLSGVGVHHDDQPAASVDLGDPLDKYLFGGELNRSVDSENQIVARHRLLGNDFRARDGSATGCNLSCHLAAGPGENVVVLQLKPSDADAVDVGPSEHGLTRGAAWHFAPSLRIDVDSRAIECSNLVADRGVDLTRNIDETAICGCDLGEQLGNPFVGQAEQVVENLHRSRPVLEKFWVNRDRRSRNRHSKLVTLAVEDRAAMGGDVGRPGPLLCASGAERLGIGCLEHDYSTDNCEQ